MITSTTERSENMKSTTSPVYSLPWIEIGQELFACVVRLDRSVAAQWRAWLHPEQRKVSHNSLEALMADMASGNFRLTHEAVCFDGSGYIIDGQHRLIALAGVREGLFVDVLVVWNKAASLRDPINVGFARTIAFLTGRAPKLTAGISAIRSLESGYRVTHKLTVAEADGIFDRHGATITELLKDIPGLGGSLGGLIAAAVWASPLDRDMVVEFVQKVLTGEMIARGNPAYAFRTWKESNPMLDSWSVSLAALNCLRAALAREELRLVFVSEVGYRTVTGRRRALKVPHTPGPQLVPSGGDRERT